MILFINFALAALTVLCLALVMAGLKRSLSHTDLPALGQKKVLRLATTLAFFWLAITFLIGKSDFLLAWDSIPPRLPFIPLAAFLCIVLLNRTTVFRKLLKSTPIHWLIAFQTFRIAVELIFWGAYQAGVAPAVVTFEGRNWDVLVGLTAPIVALGILKFNWGPIAAIVWNTLGLGILANTIFTVITSTPGRLHLDWPGEPFQLIASWPFIWIPAFLAPLAIFLHVASIRQNVMLAHEKSLSLKAIPT